MKITSSLSALPNLSSRPDVALAVGVAGIAGMLIVPLPTFALDALLSVNIACAVLMLLVALFAKKALDVSSFPSLLLITTLFRLGLNVSTTRGILAKADAGEVVKSFGQFVLQGDVIVGFVIFLVITLVQFLVIAKGAERVAEVAARFTLDAMPGKQMSIDAALRAGFYSEEEAQEKRDELGRESQMFGNMDGAMKFVKGDAIAGLIITALNLIAGFAIGVARNDMPFDAALQTYSVLTVGDGLVSQISALLITLSAGIVVTRVQGKNKDSNLGSTIQTEYLTNPKVLNVGAGLLFVLGLVPGLPFLPFAGIGVSLAIGGFAHRTLSMHRRREAAKTNPEVAAQLQLEKKLEAAKKRQEAEESLTPTVVPLSIDLSRDLSEALGFSEHGEHDVGDARELMETFIPQLRDALYLETGVRIPGVRLRSMCANLPKHTFVVRIREVPVLQETLDPRFSMATTTVENLRRLGVIAPAGSHPISGDEVAMITDDQRKVVEAAGVAVWNPAGLLALHMASVLRRRVKEFIGLQETSELVEKLERAFPALVKEVIGKVVSISQLMDVLRRLVDERVCVRDLKAIVEALGEHGAHMNDPIALTERVRASLSHQIAYDYAGLSKFLHVVLVDPVIEDTIAGAIHDRGFAIEPEIATAIIGAIRNAIAPMRDSGARPVLLTASYVRRYLKKLIEVDLPDVAVLGFEELPPDLTIQPTARAEIRELEAA